MAKQGSTRKEEFTVLGDVKYVDGKKKLVLKSPGHFQVCLNRVKEGPVAVSVSTKTPTRSQQQLAYHWVLMKYLADETGYSEKEIHDVQMRRAFGTKTVSLLGRTYEVRKSISDAAKLSKSEAVELINLDLETCEELGVHVPTLAELGYIAN